MILWDGSLVWMHPSPQHPCYLISEEKQLSLILLWSTTSLLGFVPNLVPYVQRKWWRRMPCLALSLSWCPMCKENDEWRKHLFIPCLYACKLWSYQSRGWYLTFPWEIKDFLNTALLSSGMKESQQGLFLGFLKRTKGSFSWILKKNEIRGSY